MIPLLCALALEASQRAERLADWKASGPVAETARRASQRAEADFLEKRLDYLREILK